MSTHLKYAFDLIGHGITSLEELCKSQQELIEQHQNAIELLEERIIGLEHDLSLILSQSVFKNRKNGTKKFQNNNLKL